MLSDTDGLKQGFALSSLFPTFALAFATANVQHRPVRMYLNWVEEVSAWSSMMLYVVLTENINTVIKQQTIW
jgi:hypothetical protein